MYQLQLIYQLFLSNHPILPPHPSTPSHHFIPLPHPTTPSHYPIPPSHPTTPPHHSIPLGRLLRAQSIDFNWLKLAAWINLTEQWPYRLSWMILETEDNKHIKDNMTLEELYRKFVLYPTHTHSSYLKHVHANTMYMLQCTCTMYMLT